MANNNLQTVTTTLDSVNWTAVAAPFDCNHFDCINSDTANGFSIRTDNADATTQRDFAANDSYSVLGAPVTPHFGPYRFAISATVFWARSAAGTGPLKTTFVR